MGILIVLVATLLGVDILFCGVVCNLADVVLLIVVLFIGDFVVAVGNLELEGCLVGGFLVVSDGLLVVVHIGCFVGCFVDEIGLLLGFMLLVGFGLNGFCVVFVVTGLLILLGFIVVVRTGLYVGLLAAGFAEGGLDVKGLTGTVVGLVTLDFDVVLGPGLDVVALVTSGTKIELGFIVVTAEVAVGFCFILVSFAVVALVVLSVDILV